MCMYIMAYMCVCVYVFILKMYELCLDGYEASDSKASLEPSLSSLVSSFPECVFKVVVWGQKGSLDLLV